MPSNPRGKVHPMSELSIEGCNVEPAKGLFQNDRYVLKFMNVMRRDRNGQIFIFRINDVITGSVPLTIYLNKLDHCFDHRQVAKAASAYIGHLKEQNTCKLRMIIALLSTKLTILKWRLK